MLSFINMNIGRLNSIWACRSGMGYEEDYDYAAFVRLDGAFHDGTGEICTICETFSLVEVYSEEFAVGTFRLEKGDPYFIHLHVPRLEADIYEP